MQTLGATPQMLVYLYLLNQTIRETESKVVSVEYWLYLVDNTMI